MKTKMKMLNVEMARWRDVAIFNYDNLCNVLLLFGIMMIVVVIDAVDCCCCCGFEKRKRKYEKKFINI